MVIPTVKGGPQAAMLKEERSGRGSRKETKIYFTLRPLIISPNLAEFLN